MTFIENARQYVYAYPGMVADQVRDILKVYDEGEMEHGDCVLRIATVFSDQLYRNRRICGN